MPIFPEIPNVLYKCKDGFFSSHAKKNACSWHGGLFSKDAIPLGQGGSSQLAVRDVPLQDVHVAHEWFQNRASAFSSRSVDNIIEAVSQGNFRWENFDPITLWRSPDGKMYVLSGHSRNEAFHQLYEMGLSVNGRDFSRIPAKVIEGISLEEARKIALESNTLSTKETDIERATYYRKLRLVDGMNKTSLKKAAERMEGRNASRILAFSYLSPNGMTLRALEALQSGDEASKSNIAAIATWIGNARRDFPALTDAHEDELYDWLVAGKGYGTQKGQISNERDFKARLQVVILKRTEFGVFDPSKPLNIYNLVAKSPVEQQYDAQLEEAKQNVLKLEKELTDKIAEYARRGAPEKQIQELTAGLQASLTRARTQYQNLLLAKGKMQEALKNELSLFGGIGKVVDSYPIRPNGRIDRHWQNVTPYVRMKHFLGREISNMDYLPPEQAVKKFGLHSIEFGNWLNQEDRINFWVASLYTLRDLVKILKISPDQVGQGVLALALGARGNGGSAAAFFMPDPYHLINITKTKGKGSLVHEYGHFIDFLLAKRHGGKIPSGGSSRRKQPDEKLMGGQGVFSHFEKLFDVLFWKPTGEPTAYHNDLSLLTEYFNRREEIWARTFEVYCMIKLDEMGVKNLWGLKKERNKAMPHFELVEKGMPLIEKILDATFKGGSGAVSGIYRGTSLGAYL